MILLQSTWLDIQCFNLVFRSTPYSANGILVYADDFRISNEVGEMFNYYEKYYDSFSSFS